MPTKTDYHRAPQADGDTHINVYSRGATSIGRALSHFEHAPFEHPELGSFNSVEGLWYYLKTLDPSLRDLSGYDAKKVGRELQVKQVLPQGEFRRLVNLGNEAKIRQNPHILEALYETSLPLTHYYVTKGHGAKPADSEWILAHIEEIRLVGNPTADRSNLIHLEAKRLEKEAEDEIQPSLF